jgi:hypothetical protein
MKKKRWDERKQRAIDEIQTTIKTTFPEAEFRVHHGEDPEGIYIDVYTKTDDGFAVLDLVSDRLVDLNVEERLGIYVVPLHKVGT